ncbi:hypothetical protein PRZ48_007307 [Zasmidium cellare]|uniref:Uncharacterized protein n=1 Tax=Zasmidium cellare TaxID=395010 RepID=A0ABR0EJV0_ZASCE|nr:hypothetical protein PRZ48_007307 [Zasmidium cellare]
MNNDPADNRVVAFSRDGQGRLTQVATYSTGGRGQGVDFDTQGGLALSDDMKYLYAVSPASDQITVFEVHGSCLKRVQIVYGGDQPLAITVKGRTAYVLDGSVASTGIFGFHVQDDGQLQPITNMTIPTSTPIGVPGTVLFAPDGKSVVVTNKVGSTLDYFSIDSAGNAHGPTTSPSSGQRPFAAWYTKAGKLLVVNSGLPIMMNSGVSTYNVEPSGMLAPITKIAKDKQTDGCWIVSTKDDKYAYTANFISGTISSFKLGYDGSATVLEDVAVNQGNNSNPVDLSMSRDGKYLYNLLRGTGAITGHAIQSDGSLKSIGIFGEGGALPAMFGVSVTQGGKLSRLLSSMDTDAATSTASWDDGAMEGTIQALLAARLRDHFDAAARGDFESLRQLYRDESATNFSFHGRRPHGPDTLMGMDDFLDELISQRMEFPNSRIEILDMTTTVDCERGIAKQMLNYQVLGQPEGVVKKAVGIWKWVLENGKWRVLSINTLPGLGDLTQ